MKDILIYQYVDENTQEQKISYEPLPPSSCTIRHYLVADENKILVNKTNNKKARAIIVPEWVINDWVEQDR